MPQRAKGARLYRRPDDGRWIIRDDGRTLSTGARDREHAERALARYLAEKGRPQGRRDPTEVTVAETLSIYGRERAPYVTDPARIAYSIQALVPLLGDLPLANITGAMCRYYAEARDRARGTVRKELGTLQAAINHAHAEGYLSTAPRVRLPDKPPPRDRWLTRDEVARLLRAAYRNSRTQHLARFILVAIYTGTRSEAILGLRFMPNAAGGWVDTEAGIIYRRATGKAETSKRQPPVPVPPRLLAHLRRWERDGARFVVEVGGCRVAEVKKAWATALAEAGIEHCTRHDLRRTAVTWAMQNGADKWAASGFFGLSLDMLERVYGHHHPDYLKSAVEAISRRNVRPLSTQGRGR